MKVNIRFLQFALVILALQAMVVAFASAASGAPQTSQSIQCEVAP